MAGVITKIREHNPFLGDKDEVIKGHLKLVHKIANQFRGAASASNISYDDIFSEGCIGLVKAFDRYDPTKFDGGVTKFSTYAVPMIIGEIRRFFRDKGSVIRAPRRVVSIAAKANQLISEGLDLVEISEELGCPVQEVEDALVYSEMSSVLALDQEAKGGNDSLSLLDMAGVEQDLTKIHIKEFLDSLPQNQRDIVHLRMNGFGQSEIAKRIGKSQVQVSRILTVIKERLKDNFQTDSKGASNVNEDATINGQRFQKGDVIRLDGKDAKERMYLVGFSIEIQRAYGVKLTKECKYDSRCKLNGQGWNMTISFQQLAESKILLRELTLKDIGLEDQPVDLKVVDEKREKKDAVSTRMVTQEEIKKHGIKTILDQTEWFIDSKLPAIPSISLNLQGISFSISAMKELGIKADDILEVGIAKGQLVFKKGSRGLKLRKTKERNGLILVNKRLVSWLKARHVEFKRYPIEYDQLSGAWTSKFETAEQEKIAN